MGGGVRRMCEYFQFNFVRIDPRVRLESLVRLPEKERIGSIGELAWVAEHPPTLLTGGFKFSMCGVGDLGVYEFNGFEYSPLAATV